MSDTRGLTLRKKGGRQRPQISEPKRISALGHAQKPSSENANNLAVPRDRNQQGGATSDLVKRRYSTRFNQLPDFSSGAAPIPGIPALPAQYGGPTQPVSGRISPSGGSRLLRVDANALRDPNLQAEKYITDLLSNASEQDIRDYQNSLRKIKNRVSADLQQNVYQNRTQFIKISKEAEKLKGEMRMLRGLMSELTSALGQSSPSTSSGLASPAFDEGQSRRKANRSSVANLENMWNIQLQQMWKRVEKSQTYLPAIPGRHIVLEAAHWVELDSATWKPRRPVHIVLLNDHLLVASKKRKRIDPNNTNHTGPVPTKHVAEECWPLQDIDMIDLGASLAASGANGFVDERNVGTAINVRFGGNSFTYRHEQRDESAKNDLLLTFRKTVEELRKLLRADIETSSGSPNQALMSFAATDPGLARKPEILDTINAAREKHEVRLDVDGRQQNLRWVDGEIDQLDIDIALQRFEEAVTSVERLRKLAKGLRGNSIAQELIMMKVDERATQVAGILTRALVDRPSFLSSTKLNTAWLTRLGFDHRAREAYLQVRSGSITKRARQCVFEGDLRRYIYQISFVYFTIIRNTVSIYQQCFPPLMMSACIKWAKEHLDGFNLILMRQLSSTPLDSTEWRECMDVVHQHQELLHEVGLDFRDLIGKGLSANGGS